MSKNIIICADGTGNRGGVGRGTNVWRLYNALDLNATKPRQVAKYHDGVGTKKTLLTKIVGAAFGWGLTANVRCLYRYIALNYNPGDQVYLFGFSRGAYTVRVLHNILHYLGVPSNTKKFAPQELDNHIKWVIEEYKAACKLAFKDKENVRESLQREFAELSDIAFIGGQHQRVKDVSIGVWDTVNAVGAPANWIRRLICAPWTYDEVIENLPGKSTHARQAIAIDDERSTFNPLFWPEGRSTSIDDRIIQTWFVGMHSNVGGGYPKDGLAHVSLKWMIQELGRICEQKGKQMPLRFLSRSLAEIACKANAHDKMYDSRSAMAVYYRYSPRKILTIVNRGNEAYHKWLKMDSSAADEIDYLNSNAHVTLPLIHSSVINRLIAHTDSYLPITIPGKFNVWSDQLETQSEHLSPEEACQIIETKPEIKAIELNQTVDDKSVNKGLKQWFTQIEGEKSSRAYIWAAFAGFSSYLFFAPSLQTIKGFTCKLMQKEQCVVEASQNVIAEANPFAWFVPDIAKPWLEWIVQNPPVSIIILLALSFLYLWNRHYKSRLRTSGYFFWKHLPAEASDVSVQKVENSMLMKTQASDSALYRRERKAESVDKNPIAKKWSSRVEHLSDYLAKGSTAQFRKLGKAAKKINGTDY